MGVKFLFQIASCLGLLGLCWMLAGCGDKKPPQKEQATAPVSSVTTTTAPSSSSLPSTPPVKARLDTASSASRVALETTPVKTPSQTPVPSTPSKAPGAIAYITKATAVMYKEPSEKAAPVSGTFKVSETIYVLEPKMTDETGKSYDVPQWYKIQRKDGRQGWMRARFVGLPF